MIKTTVRMTEQQKKRLIQEANRTGLDVSEIIRRSIDLYLASNPEERIAALERKVNRLMNMMEPGK